MWAFCARKIALSMAHQHVNILTPPGPIERLVTPVLYVQVGNELYPHGAAALLANLRAGLGLGAGVAEE